MTPARRVSRLRMAELGKQFTSALHILEVGIAGDDPPGANQEFFRPVEGGIYTTADCDASLNPDLLIDISLPESEAVQANCHRFDLVICSQVLEHVWMLEPAASSLWLLTAHGGTCIIDTPFLYPPHSPTDFWRLTPTALEKLCHRAGFGKVEVWNDPAWLVVGAVCKKELI